MPRTYLIPPSMELAGIDEGSLFRLPDGEIYIMIAHHPTETEIARVYWFDFVLAYVFERTAQGWRRLKSRLFGKTNKKGIVTS